MNADKVKTASAIVSVVALAFILLGSILTVGWDGQITSTDSTKLGEELFNLFGPTLIILGVLMFAAMVGGVFIAQEERE